MDFLFLLTLLIDLAASILHVLFLATGINRISQAAFWATTTGFALHTMLIALRWIGQEQFPMARWLDSISFLAWAIILIYLGITYLTRMRALGVFVVPVAFASILIAYALPQDAPGLPAYLQNYWLLAHTTLIFLSYAAFIAAFGFGVMYLIEEKKIRQKAQTLIYDRFPSLGSSDEIGHRCMVVGVILLTMGIIIGAIWTKYAQELTWRWLDSKILFTLATWSIYVMQIGIRQALGWRGRKAAYSSIVGFAAILCTYAGVNLFLPSIHAF